METATEPTNALARIPELQGIELAVAQPIIDAFMPHYEAVMKLAEQASAINVTDPTDIDGIAEARKARLAIRAARIALNKVREEKKELYLRMGKAIQGVYNRGAQVAEPAEARLQAMEDIAARMQAERKAKLAAERAQAIKPYLPVSFGHENTVDYPDLGSMSQPGFDALLTGLKAAEEKRIGDAKAAEDRKAAEEFERWEREEEIKAENARLKAKADADAQALHEERVRVKREQDAKDAAHAAQVEAERKKAAAKLAAERAAFEAAAEADRIQAKKEADAKAAYLAELAQIAQREQAEAMKRHAIQLEAEEEKRRQERAAAEAAARKEREARERAEAMARRVEEAERERKRVELAKAEAEQKARDDAAKAPDVEKCRRYVSALMDVDTPVVKSKECQQFTKAIVATLNEYMQRAEKL